MWQAYRNSDAMFCTQYGANLQGTRSAVAGKRSAFLTAAGILTIIAACLIAILGIYYMALFVIPPYPSMLVMRPLKYFVTGLFGILGFTFGLTAGILTLIRTLFAMAIFGMALMMVLASVLFFVGRIVASAPVLVLTILSIIITGIRKEEFK